MSELDEAKALYTVRCNFAGSSAEEKRWNEWYNEVHCAKFLSLPGFVGVERFRIAALDDHVKYLTTWHIEDVHVLESGAYKGVSGGSWPAEWADSITDWSRSVYERVHSAYRSSDR